LIFFALGVYFTQFPSYGMQYADGHECLLLSWVLMGKVYPVTEGVTSAESLEGTFQTYPLSIFLVHSCHSSNPDSFRHQIYDSWFLQQKLVFDNGRPLWSKLVPNSKTGKPDVGDSGFTVLGAPSAVTGILAFWVSPSRFLDQHLPKR
jgi:hypothetical protein